MRDQTLGSSEGDVCSHAVPFPFKPLLQFKAAVAKALTPNPTLCPLGWPNCRSLGWGWGGECPGRCTKDLTPSGDISFPGMCALLKV